MGDESRCRWSTEAREYLDPDGEKCDTPKREHCTARRSCSHHLGWGEQTCARCYGRTRTDIRQIVELMATMPTEAEERGTVDTEPAMLAGPAGDPLVLSWRAVNVARTGGGSVGDGTDETDPTYVLGTWMHMLAEDYGDDLPDRITLTNAAAYLERNLNRVAQDEAQDFPLMAREIRKCRSRLESVLRDSQQPERGAPCPTCAEDKQVVRLNREYGHWCESATCTRFHFLTDEADRWVCPRNPMHAWDVDAYERWITERRGA